MPPMLSRRLIVRVPRIALEFFRACSLCQFPDKRVVRWTKVSFGFFADVLTLHVGVCAGVDAVEDDEAWRRVVLVIM